MLRGLLIILSVVVAAQAQQGSLPGPGQFSATVRGEDGSTLSGVGVFLRRTPTLGAPPRQRMDWTAVTSTTGIATFELLPSGQYTICAQAASGNWLNPCEWGAARPSIVVPGTRESVGPTLVLKRGATVSIRVDDPSGLLTQDEGKTPGAHLLLGVRSDAGMFRLASLKAKDAGAGTIP